MSKQESEKSLTEFYVKINEIKNITDKAPLYLADRKTLISMLDNLLHITECFMNQHYEDNK